ncbi:MAG: TetR/AcrR family transcriptional regulator [Bacillota bacterium]
MGLKERKEREKENLRRAILEAAEDLFVREGFENVSMRKIARKIEYSPTTIYLYFQDKVHLFHCLLEDYHSQLLEALNSVEAEYDDPITTMKKQMRVYIGFGLKNPGYYKLAFMSSFADVKTDQYLTEGSFGTEAFMSLRRLVAKCINRGLFRPLDVDLIAQVLWTMNHGITSLLITNPNFPWVDIEKLIDQAIESAIEGFRS